MQNKAGQTPYGSTVIPNAPMIQGNGIAEGQGPPGVPSAIPGTIGVAGATVRSEGHNPTEHYRLPDGRTLARGETGELEVKALAQAAGQGALAAIVGQGALDGLVNLIVERLAPRVADAVIERLRGLPTMAVRSAPHDIAGRALQRDVAISPPMVAGAAAQVREHVAAGVDQATTQAIGIPPDQIKAYSEAHKAAGEVISAAARIARHEERAVLFEGLRGWPEPPAFALTAKNGARSEWSVYSAAYDQPRFRLAIPPGVLPADRYLVMLQGTKLGYMMLPQLIEAMNHWLADNAEPIPEVASETSGSGINTID